MGCPSFNGDSGAGKRPVADINGRTNTAFSIVHPLSGPVTRLYGRKTAPALVELTPSMAVGLLAETPEAYTM
jgi:hypothetical protein